MGTSNPYFLWRVLYYAQKAPVVGEPREERHTLCILQGTRCLLLNFAVDKSNTSSKTPPRHGLGLTKFVFQIGEDTFSLKLTLPVFRNSRKVTPASIMRSAMTTRKSLIIKRKIHAAYKWGGVRKIVQALVCSVALSRGFEKRVYICLPMIQARVLIATAVVTF